MDQHKKSLYKNRGKSIDPNHLHILVQTTNLVLKIKTKNHQEEINGRQIKLIKTERNNRLKQQANE